MKKSVWGILLVGLVSTFVLIFLLTPSRLARAQNVDACYGVADNGGAFGNEDALVALDRVTGVTTIIGHTGTNAIEAITFAPGGGNLYAANNNRLGILSLTTGAFTQLAEPFGTGSGADGNVGFSDVDGLDYDAATDIVYGTHRRDSGLPDVLIQINRATGAHVPGAFGGDDYVVIDGPGVLHDIDDIAVDPITGVMYGASNTGGDGGVLITINKSTGAATVVGEFGVDDIEGLSYFNDGQLYGSTGKDGRDSSTRNQLYLIDETTAEATLVAPFDDFRDYEALACLTGPTSIALADLSVASVAPTGAWLLAALLMLGVLTLYAIRRRAI